MAKRSKSGLVDSARRWPYRYTYLAGKSAACLAQFCLGLYGPTKNRALIQSQTFRVLETPHVPHKIVKSGLDVGSDRQPAIHNDLRAGNEGGSVGGQEQGGLRNILRESTTPKRMKRRRPGRQRLWIG
jgi:hypothetical protein